MPNNTYDHPLVVRLYIRGSVKAQTRPISNLYCRYDKKVSEFLIQYDDGEEHWELPEDLIGTDTEAGEGM